MLTTIQWDGKPISVPGLYAGIPLETYHAHDIADGSSLSSSQMRKIISESPAHFFAEWRGNPNRKPEKESRAKIIGSAVHHLILDHRGQPTFSKNFAVQPEEYEADEGEIKPWNNNAKDCKRWHANMKEQRRAVLLQKELPQIEGMARTLGMHPIVRAGALNGQVERSMFWKDKKTGIWLKSRPDTIPGDGGDFVDLKTTLSVIWGDLVRTIDDYGYHQQGGLVRRGARELFKINTRSKIVNEEDGSTSSFMPNFSFSLIFVEKENPWPARVVTLKDHMLDLGEQANQIAIETFARCLKSGHWPGPGGDREDAEPIELSDYAQNRIKTQLLIQGG